ncbi:HYPER-SENSITIVITY-RELATED 4 protein [Nymphaea thermarum]|nr:HYPER-SENSITIVITY-RELATED 4 protein [Nymphaea thermarum]
MESGMTWTSWGSVLASFMFMAAFAKDYLPFSPQALFMKVSHRLFDLLYPYAEIRIDEMGQERWYLTTTKIFELITVYLAANTSKSARKMRANLDNDTENLKLSMDEHQQITDEFQGITVWWSSHTTSHRSSSYYDRQAEERRHYVLTYNKRYRDLIINSYLKHVCEEAKAIEVTNRRRKLFTNTPSRENEYFSSKKKAWSPVTFDHPSSFHTLAMDHAKKADILEDLDFFKNGKDYYRKIGKTWKRGYLLYGPPGTGKSTLIAAIAKHMDYDVYDLELTAVKNNTDLRKLLIETSSKSIIVIEDIDCSVDLTADRKKKKKKTSEEGSSETQGAKQRGMESSQEESKVTLSGLLNFIDGLWSSCGEERLIIFTTNHIEKLDPALIRTGRMDKQIEMSYCTYEGFTVLAQNFLDLESHSLFADVRKLIEIEKVEVTPADVAEKLMPRTMHEKHSKTPCLEKVIEFMKNAKEDKMKKQNDGEPQDSTDQEDSGLPLSEGSD